MAEVLLNNVTKVYPGDVKAVDSANLDIRDGEFVVLVGPSGCGKTTTLRMVAGLEDITQGTINIGERVINDVAPKDRDIAMVFQNYALYPHMSVYKNMAFGLKMRKMKKDQIDQRVQKAAKLLDIQHLLERKPKALSGGQRQRVAVGRAIVRDPKAFLFDEPLSNLDAKLRGVMRAELKELHARLKTTTIYVTHDQEEAMSLGDLIVVMHGGIIRQVGAPLDVYDRPADRFVAGFVGTPPMNFLEGYIRRTDGKFKFDLSGTLLDLPERYFPCLADCVDQKMVLGARPENIKPVDAEHAAPGETVGMKVIVSEPLGGVRDVYLNHGPDGQRVIMRCDAHVRVPHGGDTLVKIDLERTHVFETGELGMNVTLNGNSNGVGA